MGRKEKEEAGERKKEGSRQRRAGKGPSERSQLRKVELVFQAPEARQVFVAGDFNNWDPTNLPMKRHKEGVWKTKLKLAPGRYEYKFFADGQWVHYVKGVERVPNPYGTDNLVMWVD